MTRTQRIGLSLSPAETKKVLRHVKRLQAHAAPLARSAATRRISLAAAAHDLLIRGLTTLTEDGWNTRRT